MRPSAAFGIAARGARHATLDHMDGIAAFGALGSLDPD